MNVVPLTASSPGAVGAIAELSASHGSGKAPLKGAALRNASPTDQRKEVAAQFEAILVRQLLGPTMASMLGKDGGTASSVYGDMLTDTFAQQLTRSGGFGLSHMLEAQLAPRTARRSLSPSDSSEESL